MLISGIFTAACAHKNKYYTFFWIWFCIVFCLGLNSLSIWFLPKGLKSCRMFATSFGYISILFSSFQNHTKMNMSLQSVPIFGTFVWKKLSAAQRESRFVESQVGVRAWVKTTLDRVINLFICTHLIDRCIMYNIFSLSECPFWFIGMGCLSAVAFVTTIIATMMIICTSTKCIKSDINDAIHYVCIVFYSSERKKNTNHPKTTTTTPDKRSTWLIMRACCTNKPNENRCR